MSKKLLLVLIFAASVVLRGSSGLAQSEEEAKSPNPDSEIEEMAELVPGFGGMFYDEKGQPTVYLTDSSSELRLKSIIPDVVILQGDYDFRTLQRYRVELRSALSIDGVVALDVDERSNRVRISISQDLNPKQRSQLRRRLMRMSADPDAVTIDERPEFLNHATVQDTVRPVVGGLQIASPRAVCTLGFVVNRGTQFITNSHCTLIPGVVENTPFTQNARGRQIGVEVVDPLCVQGPGCPPGRVCCNSDAALADFNPGTFAGQGLIARTVTCNTGTFNDFELNGNLFTSGTATASVGQVVTKVGNISGCRRGTVAQTCADVNVGGTNTTLLCQTIVQANGFPISLPGDSGSPVFFQDGNNAVAVGLLWGGSSDGSLMAFSPISQVIAALW